MPVTPPQVTNLLETYDDLVNQARTVTEAVAAVAPAAVGEVLCQIGGLASLGAGPFGPLQSPGTSNRLLSDLGGVLAAACPVPPPLPEPPPPPFSGGQCPGISYVVNITTEELERFDCTADTRTFNRTIVGPITDFRIRDPFEITTCPGGETGGFVLEALFDGNQNYGAVYQASQGNTVITGFTINSVTRADGQPDDCGDPPAPPTPPRPPIVQPPQSPQIPTIDPDGNPGPPIVIIPKVGPIYVDIDGQISIPVVVNVEGNTVNNNISFPLTVKLPDFNVSFEYGGGGGSTNDPEGPEEPTPPEGICCEPPLPELEEGEEENPDDPPPEEEEEIVRIQGIVLVCSPDGGQRQNSTIFTAQPAVLVPRIATVQFEMRIAGELYLSEETQIKSLRRYVAAPTDVDIVRAFVGYEPGWTGSFQYVVVAANPAMR